MTQVETRPGVKKRWSWMAQTLILTNLALLVLAVYAIVEFGSIQAALSYARGDRLLADSYTKSFGSIDDGKDRSLSFRLSNLADRPITLLGANSSCTCTVAEGLPLTIPPESQRPLQITIRPRQVGPVAETVRLFTDFKGELELTIRVSGQVTVPRTAPQPARDQAKGS